MKCRVCESENLACVWEMLGHTPSKQLFKQKQEQYYQWDMRLWACESCGFIQISEPLDAKLLYENYLFPTSWKLHPHTKALIERLCTLAPRGSRILEIGCNDGAFLHELRGALGSELALGIEPSKDVCALAQKQGLELINDFFTPALARGVKERRGAFDVIYSRHVFEHVEDLGAFLEGVRILAHDKSVIMIEVPNCQAAIEMGDISIFWEEHVNYFSPLHLRYVLEKSGFSIMDMRSYEFSGESVVCFAQVSGASDRAMSNGVRDRARAHKGAGAKSALEKSGAYDFSVQVNSSLAFSRVARKRLDSLSNLMQAVKSQNGEILAYGGGA